MSQAGTPSKKRLAFLDLAAEQALFRGEIDGLAIACCTNERPLAGLAGLIDWRLHGMISENVRSGLLTGRAGECVYVPVTKFGRTLHLLFLGAGASETPGARKSMPRESLKAFQSNFKSLKLKRFGLSLADFGEEAITFITADIQESSEDSLFRVLQ